MRCELDDGVCFAWRCSHRRLRERVRAPQGQRRSCEAMIRIGWKHLLVCCSVFSIVSSSFLAAKLKERTHPSISRSVQHLSSHISPTLSRRLFPYRTPFAKIISPLLTEYTPCHISSHHTASIPLLHQPKVRVSHLQPRPLTPRLPPLPLHTLPTPTLSSSIAPINLHNLPPHTHPPISTRVTPLLPLNPPQPRILHHRLEERQTAVAHRMRRLRCAPPPPLHRGVGCVGHRRVLLLFLLFVIRGRGRLRGRSQHAQSFEIPQTLVQQTPERDIHPFPAPAAPARDFRLIPCAEVRAAVPAELPPGRRQQPVSLFCLLSGSTRAPPCL